MNTRSFVRVSFILVTNVIHRSIGAGILWMRLAMHSCNQPLHRPEPIVTLINRESSTSVFASDVCKN
jgi:hypothetical protein